jgi:integrase
MKRNSFLIGEFLKEVKKRSEGSYSNHKANLNEFFNYIEDKPIQKITMFDIRDYFINELDGQKIKISTKNTKRFMLKSFFDFVEKMLLNEDILYPNPVPSTKIFQFTKLNNDILRRSQTELKILTPEQLKTILDHAFHNYSLRDFLLIGFAVCTGARISEIRTMLVNDIYLDECFFETGFAINARKSTLRKGEGLLFFFPEPFAIYLERYLEENHEGSKWLFPGYKGKPITHETTYHIYKNMSKELDIRFSWHYFRRTLITERRKMGCPEWVSEGLMNHTASTVERESYIKLKISEKKSYYDQYFPYKNLNYFI